MFARQRWQIARQRLNSLYVFAASLLVVGAILLAVWARTNQPLWSLFGGAVFGSGLTVLVGTLTGHEAVRQQYAKEANLRRKTETYGPLHAEIKSLRETLDAARQGTGPYPRQIVMEQIGVSEYTGLPITEGPTLQVWPSFKGDYHADDFSVAAHQRFDAMQERAKQYNATATAARMSATAALKPRIMVAIEAVVGSPEYQHWQDTRAQQHRQPGIVPQDRSWFSVLAERLANPVETPDSLADKWARAWVERWPMAEPDTVGWLLAGRQDQAVQCVEAGFRSAFNTYDTPPQGWIEDIFKQADVALVTDPAFQQAREALQHLYASVREAEGLLERGLQTIRDRYEGGTPLV